MFSKINDFCRSFKRKQHAAQKISIYDVILGYAIIIFLIFLCHFFFIYKKNMNRFLFFGTFKNTFVSKNESTTVTFFINFVFIRSKRFSENFSREFTDPMPMRHPKSTGCRTF